MRITCIHCKTELGSLDVGFRPEPISIPTIQPEAYIDPKNDMLWNGDTRTAYEFKQWKSTAGLEFGDVDINESTIILRYSDGSYINVNIIDQDGGMAYHVIVSNSEVTCGMRIEAEIYLWNEHARLERAEQFGRVRLK